MENLVLTIGGLLKAFGWSDLFFFSVTLIMVLLLVYIAYLVKLDESNSGDIKDELLSYKSNQLVERENKESTKPLTAIINQLESDYKPKPIDLSDYEKEQENTAIISYDELLSRATNNIYYDDEYESGFDDIIIQKIDNKESKTQELVDLPRAIMMSYESEEEFLSALKSLQKNLVR